MNSANRYPFWDRMSCAWLREYDMGVRGGGGDAQTSFYGARLTFRIPLNRVRRCSEKDIICTPPPRSAWTHTTRRGAAHGVPAC